MPMGRRVVVTGLGLVSPLGVGVQSTWQRLLEGQSGVQNLAQSALVASSSVAPEIWASLPSQVAAMVPRGSQAHQFDPDRDFPTHERRMMSTAMKYSLMSAHEALQDAQLTHIKDPVHLTRMGVAVGMAMVDLEYISQNYAALTTGHYKKVGPYFVPRILPNLAPGHISIEYGFQGPNHAVSTACATGSHAIGDAYRFIRNNSADVMVCGGTEACVDPLAIAGFSRARALSTRFNDRPQESSRPFDRDRDGFVIGEGAGILVLEELQHALERGARIYGEVLGYGLSGDAHHITAGPSDGHGAVLAMKAAFKSVGAEQIDHLWHINAHATSTPLGDVAELRAVQTLLADSKNRPFVTANKGNLGHLLGAAGSAESILALKSMQTGIIPRTINVENLDPDIDSQIRIVVGENVDESELNSERPQRLTLKNSFGFGGTNVSLLFGQYTG
uniref:3-oxoacyl-[acyl-carrier-protein] synthase n=1 Tax=Tigriopus japonicus TaxID=158387 RepID=A0A343U6Y8_TIGJA|nr:3-oxoacyl-[acyl-carrier-protein] synthase [Tigriopus japonicus]